MTDNEIRRNPPGSKSDYEYFIHSAPAPGRTFPVLSVLVIRDLDMGGVTVTNNVRSVLREIEHVCGCSTMDMLIIYKDSMGNYDGILHVKDHIDFYNLAAGKQIVSESDALDAARSKLMFYVIEDLSTWMMSQPSLCEREIFMSVDAAIAKFKKYRANPYDYSDGYAKLAMGVHTPSWDVDLLHVINNTNYLLSDFSFSDWFKNHEGLHKVLKRIHDDIGFDMVKFYRGGSSPPVFFNLDKWEVSARILGLQESEDDCNDL